MINDGNKLGRMTENGLEIFDEKIYSSLENKKISASLITGVLDCPARWVSNYLLNEFLPADLDNAMTRGSFFHRIMELFFMLEPEERVKSAIYYIKQQVFQEEEFQHFAKNTDAINWVDQAINNYYDMGAQPQLVQIAEYNENKGLEVFVQGKIEGCERPFLGFIDRLALDNQGNYIIEDWKTGAKAKHYTGDRYETGWAEARQQILYSEIIKQNTTKEVSEARLLFPVAKEIVKVDIKNETLIKKATNDTIKAEKKLNKMVENNNFNCNPSFLCHWCPLAKICPQAPTPYVKNKKARISHLNQPEPTELSQGIEF